MTGSAMTGNGPPAVAHLVTPYLFPTGSWIHAQLIHASGFRPLVITQATEHLDQFPFNALYNLAPASAGLRRPGFLLHKYLFGAFPAGPYRRILERESVRILHAHTGWEAARTVGLSRSPRRPFVASFYGRDAGVLSRSRYWRGLYRRLFAQADRIIAEGMHMAEVLHAIGAPRESICVVHLGIPLEEFPFVERRDRDEGNVVGLTAASFREKKGILQALEAMALIAPGHPRLRLRIIGDGPLRPDIEARVLGPDLRSRVDLLGYQPYAAYKEELYKAHFLLAPSLTARDGDTEGGAPVCLLEAQASGLPVVSTTHCDIPEATAPGRSALLAPEGDIQALASRLEDLLSRPQDWPEMGRAGREHVAAGFDIREQVRRMGEVYRELL